jgi:PAS domain S-box-containing protein
LQVNSCNPFLVFVPFVASSSFVSSKACDTFLSEFPYGHTAFFIQIFTDNGKTAYMMHAEWLPIIMQGSFCEIYVIEPKSLRFLHVNQTARKNLQYTARELEKLTPSSIVSKLSPKRFRQMIQPLCDGIDRKVTLNFTHVRKDGSTYPVELRLLFCASPSAPAIIAFGHDNSARDKSAQALHASQKRLHAIASNMPGLAFQFVLQSGGKIAFPYLSNGCQALLGLSAARLRSDPSLFLKLILPEDRPSYVESMNASAQSLQAWNWEGRLWIEKWKDIKWVSLRAIPHALSTEEVQWEGMMANITETKSKEAELKASREQLAELSAHVATVKEQEQTRIAQEIHDDIGGNLTAIKMALKLLTRRLPSDDVELAGKARYIDSLVDRTIEAIHRISVDLRPGILEFGIVPAIEWQAKEFETHSGIACAFTSNRSEIDLHPDQATALFRIFQETLTNIAKHADATKVVVRLARMHRYIHLEVADNGKGIVATDRFKPKSFGIRGMMERASALGGSLTIGNAPAGGSLVTVKIPLALPGDKS